MLNDDPLLAAFQRQQPKAPALVDIERRVRAQHWKRGLQRGVEAALSLAALALFAWATISGKAGPHVWVLMPFFLVFIPLIWALLLRDARGKARHAADAVSDFARLRLQQLRVTLRELWRAKQAARALLIYALIVFALAFGFGDAGWRAAANSLLLWSLIWALLSWLFVRRHRRRQLREYRALRRLLPSPRQSWSGGSG